MSVIDWNLNKKWGTSLNAMINSKTVKSFLISKNCIIKEIYELML